MQPLVMTRHLAASPSRVFAAWSDPAVMRTWFAPGDLHVAELSADARPGGHYRIVMQEPDGKQHITIGEYITLQPDSLVEFTWRWEGSDVTTRVRIDLAPAASGGTDLTLTHAGLPTEQSIAEHERGWTGCLAKLDPALAA